MKLLSVVSGHVSNSGGNSGAGGTCGRPQCGMGGCAGPAAVPRHPALAINLVANLIFTPIQVGMRNLPLAAVDILVVYRQEYGDHGLWVRPAAMFAETVMVDGRAVP